MLFWYILNRCLIFFYVYICHSFTSKMDQWQRSCVCLVELPLVLFLGHWNLCFWEAFVLLFLCWGYFWQGVNAQIAVLVTMEKLSHKKAYALFFEDGQTLNLPNFLLTCSSEVHFVPVVFRLKIHLAHTCVLLAFAICTVLMEKEKYEDQNKRGIYPESLHITRENECSCSLIARFCWERAHDYFGSEFIRDFWYILMYVS